MATQDQRAIITPEGFSLSQTCGPVVWSRGRWPDMDWLDGRLIWLGWEGERVVWRGVRQRGDTLLISGTAEAALDAVWASRVLGLEQVLPAFDDPVVRAVSERFPGLRSFSHGSLYAGLVTAIVGQSISVAAAAVAQTRLSLLFNTAIQMGARVFVPLPRADQLATAEPSMVRACGVTNRRAAALVAIAGAACQGGLPNRETALSDADGSERALRALPLVGPWTARSALLWGHGAVDAFPAGDVALLRAARGAYGQPGLDLRGLDHLSDGWRPARGLASRLLWTNLLGTAPES